MKITTTFLIFGNITIIFGGPVDKTKEIITANNRFSDSVYKEVLKQNEGKNFIVSPFSAATVLALTQSGAEGKTGQELRTALHLPDDQSKIENLYEDLLPTLKSDGRYTLNSANKIYVKNGFAIKEDYKKIATESYKSDVEGIDFVPEVIKAATNINKWVEKQTNNKIKDLVKPEVLGNDTRLVLVTALYLKADWQITFDVHSTHQTDFYKTAEDIIKTNTMHKKSYFNYYESLELDAKFLELPFNAEDASLFIVLPNEREGLSLIEDRIGNISVEPKFNREYVNMALPRFKIDTQINFVDILKNLGVTKVFDGKRADLSGISGKAGDLYISNVLQKAFIDVNENGVEAAAATYVVVAVPPALIQYPEPKEFVADHPFIFYIKVKGLIVFAGRVIDPNY